MSRKHIGVLAAIAAVLLGAVAPATATRAGQLVVPRASRHLPATWHQAFVIGYGTGRELLGTSPGGDAGSLDLGPEYGAPGPDGTWWFLDTAKARIAHYDATGHYLGQQKVAKALLVNGRYFPWQLPHVLADGTFVASRQGADRTYLLRVRNGTVDEIPVDGTFAALYDNGRRLYGFDGHGRQAVVDPRTGSLHRTAYFRTPSGTRFAITAGSSLRVDLPDSGIVRSLSLVTASGARAHVGVQVRAGADDTIHLYLLGAGEDDESVQLTGATRVSPAGAVARAEALPNPFSTADPGSPAELQLAPGSSTPMLVYVRPDGVHVYERTG